jgi:hypothetical protein
MPKWRKEVLARVGLPSVPQDLHLRTTGASSEERADSLFLTSLINGWNEGPENHKAGHCNLEDSPA